MSIYILLVTRLNSPKTPKSAWTITLQELLANLTIKEKCTMDLFEKLSLLCKDQGAWALDSTETLLRNLHSTVSFSSVHFHSM